MHILTYDLRGTVISTGAPKPCRVTGLVTHTHMFLAGLARRYPNARVAVTQTGAKNTGAYELRTPEGQVVLAQGIRTGFPEYLRSADGGKNPERVREFYESRINEADNPVYLSLARQYAQAVLRAGIPTLLAQNTNPIVGVLKADEFGFLDSTDCMHMTAVVHDTADMERRFAYIRDRMEQTRITVNLIAVSDAVRRYLVEQIGIPPHRIRTVRNGIDDIGFLQTVESARRADVFARVRERNALPSTGRMILMSARRVAWKGQADVLDAVARLVSRGQREFYVAFNGAGLTDTREGWYEGYLRQRIKDLGLEGTAFLLDELDNDQFELAACYGQAYAAVHPSRQPEPFGYTNIEAMLAGVPLITTAHGAPLEYITPGESGRLVPPENPAAIAEALGQLLNDPQLHSRLADGGYASATRFGLDAMFEGYDQAIRAHFPCRSCHY
ncbi:glycosyltransferase family 4 protein [Saccharopolyspora hattusasensis]|uniref:glycosyltransferase family 4 protein n=1 Tax=Saccharopolyspora hattusasensis TaxID=1128679 RepID=UPI003D98BB4E